MRTFFGAWSAGDASGCAGPSPSDPRPVRPSRPLSGRPPPAGAAPRHGRVPPAALSPSVPAPCPPLRAPHSHSALPAERSRSRLHSPPAATAPCPGFLGGHFLLQDAGPGHIHRGAGRVLTRGVWWRTASRVCRWVFWLLQSLLSELRPHREAGLPSRRVWSWAAAWPREGTLREPGARLQRVARRSQGRSSR